MTESAPSPTPGWYPNPDGSGDQRYWDGQQWGERKPADAKPSKKRKWPWIVGALVALIVVISIAGGGGDKDAPESNDRQTSANTGAIDRDQPAASDSQPGIGVPVRDGKFEFIVTRVDRSATAGDPTNEFLQQQATGEFINVHLTVTNIGDKAQQFFATNQKLIVDGKQFDAASVLGLPGDMSTINPGLSIETVVPFDVPPGSQPEAIELHDSAFSGGAKVGLR